MKTEEQKRHRRERQRITRAAWRKKNPSEYLSAYLRRSWGISLETYEAMRAAQGERCAICRHRFVKGARRPHVDHDHRTGRFRGVLCHDCNVGIGGLKDDPCLIARALAYLVGMPPVDAHVDLSAATPRMMLARLSAARRDRKRR